MNSLEHILGCSNIESTRRTKGDFDKLKTGYARNWLIEKLEPCLLQINSFD